MALEVLFFGGFIDGDEPRDPASADYVAGSAAAITAAGVARTATDADFVGLFKNDKSEDDVSGPQAADQNIATDLDTGVVVGANKVSMSPGTLADGTTLTAFVFPGSGGGGWAVGDELFLVAAGRWDNQGGGIARGRVTKAPASATDNLIAWMYGANAP